MKAAALLVGLVLSANAWGAVVGLRPYLVNGAVVPDARVNSDVVQTVVLSPGNQALVEVFVEGLQYQNADVRTGIGAFDVRIGYDPSVVALSDPNFFTVQVGGNDILFDVGEPFQPLGSEGNCGLARGAAGCPDALGLFEGSGRDIQRGPITTHDDVNGTFRVEISTSGDEPTPLAGVLAVFQMEFLGAGGVGAQALTGDATLSVLEGSLFIRADTTGDTIPLELGSLLVNPVPLPGSGLALLSALGVLAYRAWRRSA